MSINYAYSICDSMDQLCIPYDSQYQHIYVGSTFCDRYFIDTSLGNWKEVLRRSRDINAKLSLVIPITSQLQLQNMKAKLDQLVQVFENTLDEVVVNDYAMLQWIGENYNHVSIWCGRLLVKDVRDPRLFKSSSSCYLLDYISTGKLNSCPIKGIEIDSFVPIEFRDIPGIEFGIHYPYCYISTGRLCEIGSMNSFVSEKFRVDGTCSRQCEKNWIWYRNSGISMLKYGRAVYSTIDDQIVLSKLSKQVNIRIIEDGFAKKTNMHKERRMEDNSI